MKTELIAFLWTFCLQQTYSFIIPVQVCDGEKTTNRDFIFDHTNETNVVEFAVSRFCEEHNIGRNFCSLIMESAVKTNIEGKVIPNSHLQRIDLAVHNEMLSQRRLLLLETEMPVSYGADFSVVESGVDRMIFEDYDSIKQKKRRHLPAQLYINQKC